MSGRLRSGSIVLEYLMTLLLAIPFLILWLTFYEPGVGWTEAGDDFTGYFRRMMTGVAMPIP